jgi:hypothetical protein
MRAIMPVTAALVPGSPLGNSGHTPQARGPARGWQVKGSARQEGGQGRVQGGHAGGRRGACRGQGTAG